MRTALLGMAIAAATALIGWLGDPADAGFFAFFGMWGVLLLWSADRAPAAGPEVDHASAEHKPETDIPVRT
jgi:hypothetical protein